MYNKTHSWYSFFLARGCESLALNHEDTMTPRDKQQDDDPIERFENEGGRAAPEPIVAKPLDQDHAALIRMGDEGPVVSGPEDKE